MPATIPYHSGLILGSVVSKAVLDDFTKIKELQAPVDAASDSLKTLQNSRRSLEKTLIELTNLGIDAADGVANIRKEISALDSNIEHAAKNYAELKSVAQTAQEKLGSSIETAVAAIESPLDRKKSQNKNLPIAADTVTIGCQYFTFDSKKQSSESFTSAIVNHVSSATGHLGKSVTTQASSMVDQQLSTQLTRNDVAGVLVISSTCTHKVASMMAPLVLDTDKAFELWKKLRPDDYPNTINEQTVQSILEGEHPGADDKLFSIVSGTAFGSAVVGSIFILGSGGSTTSQSVDMLVSFLQAKFDSALVDRQLQRDNFDSSFRKEIKNRLDSSSITYRTGSIAVPAINTGVDTDETIDSLFTSLDIHVKNASASTSSGANGAPVNCYIKDVTPMLLAEMWLTKPRF